MRPIFIGGCNRSGTTFLGSLLGTHSQCLCIPEMPFKFGLQRALEREGSNGPKVLERVGKDWRFQIWGSKLAPSSFVSEDPSAKNLVEWIVKKYGDGVGKPDFQCWVDHTPRNLRHSHFLVNQFPEARMIHIVRDGRAVASSMMRVDRGPNEIEDAAHFWVDRLARALAAELFWGPERVIRVRYEDLVQEPESTVERLCQQLKIDYEAEMVLGTGVVVPKYTASQHALVGRPPNTQRVDAWEDELTTRQIEIFESVAADLLLSLGYPLRNKLGARRISRSEYFASRVHDLYRKATNWNRGRRRIRMGVARRDAGTTG